MKPALLMVSFQANRGSNRKADVVRAAVSGDFRLAHWIDSLMRFSDPHHERDFTD